MKTNSFVGGEKSAKVKKSPGMVFRLFDKNGDSRLLPKKVDGIHALSAYLLKDTLEANGFANNELGKVCFVEAVLNNGLNKDIGYVEAVAALAPLIPEAYSIEIEGKNAPLNVRIRKQLIFGIKKELELCLRNHNKI
jgi:hypothetical protein